MDRLLVRLLIGAGTLLFVIYALLTGLNVTSPTSSQLFIWTASAMIAIGISAVAVALVTEVPAAAKFASEVVPFFVRGIGLVALLCALVYFAFFFDKSSFSHQLVTTLTTQEGHLAGLERKLERLRKEQRDFELSVSLTKNVPGAETTQDTVTSRRLKYIYEELPHEVDAVEAEIESTKRNVKRLQDRAIDSAERDHNSNVLFAIRALCLGGIGALVTLLARKTIGSNPLEPTFFHTSRYWPLLITHTIVGALISLVAFALLYTKQITIFKPDLSGAVATGEPEFWRVTLLCIVAGAFADKIYVAVSSRVEKYTNEENSPKRHAD